MCVRRLRVPLLLALGALSSAGCAPGTFLTQPFAPPYSRDELLAKIRENAPKDAQTLVVNVYGSGRGKIATVPEVGLDCESSVGLCWAYAVAHTTVAITPTPERGSVFVSWGGNCAGTGSCVVDMTVDHEVSAVFEPHSVTVLIGGSGKGTVTSDVGGLLCGPGQCAVTLDDVVPGLMTLTAVPATGSHFAGWSGAACSGVGPCELRTDRAKTLTAFFEPDAVAVHLWAPGAGRGTVSFGGKSCAVGSGASTCTISIAETTPPERRTLVAAPEAGSVFVGWGGACSGTGPCNLPASQDHHVTAVFEPASAAPDAPPGPGGGG